MEHSLQRDKSDYKAFPRADIMVLIAPPMKVSAAMASTATRPRISAYSANPWPSCPLGTHCRTGLSLTLRSTFATCGVQLDVTALSPRR